MLALAGRGELASCNLAKSEFQAGVIDPERVRQHVEQGPPAFAPSDAGLMQMIGMLLAERVLRDARVLAEGAGGGLETRYLAGLERR